MFVENFTKFMKYYGDGRRLKLFGFFLLSLVVGFMEFLGIALIYPFILLIINPESIIHTKYYLHFVRFFHINDILMSAFLLGFIVVFLFIVKNLFMIFFVYLQNKFMSDWKLSLNKKFMHFYLFSSYRNSLKTSPSEKLYNLNCLPSQALDNFIFRIINLTTNAIVMIMILGFLIIKFPFAAVFTGVFVYISMLLQNKYFKNKTKEISAKNLKLSNLCNEKTLENINNLKEIKILSAENYFYDEYSFSLNMLSDITVKNSFYTSIPTYIVEILVVLALFVLAILVSLQNIDNTSWMIASYAVIAASIFRIAPALNRIQTAINVINSSRDFVKTIILEYEKGDFTTIEEKSSLEIGFKKSLELKNISFAYKKTPVISGLDLKIKKGEFIGIIGTSGAGKSTLADIIMGLLPVDGGKILLDNVELKQENFSALRKLIGYVPQQVNILDGSFKRNVALGDLSMGEIDEKKVISALKKARLYDFVNNFEDGINCRAIVGSSGLSQGQKQRLAIARALYREAEILIFDEATSALDVDTEYEITRMLNALKGDKTIIAIAHRLSTLKSCDRLIYLKDGKISDEGTFEELSAKNKDVERLIRLSNVNRI